MANAEEILQKKRDLLERKKQLLKWQQSLFAEDDRYDIGDARISAIGQGLTFGVGDELKALGKGGVSALTTPGTGEQRKEAFGLGYDTSMTQDKIKRDALSEQFPKTTMGFEGLGGAITGGAAFKAMTPLLKGLSPAARLAGGGAVEGGIYGAAASDPGQRLSGSGAGMLFGALGTPLMVGVGAASMKVLRPAAKRLGEALFGKPRDVAVKRVVAALDAEDITPDEAFTLLRSMGRNATIADLGDAPARLGRVVTSEAGSGASKAKRFLDARQLTQQMELRQTARRATGASNYEKGINEIINSAESKAAPIYSEVYSEVLDVTPAMLDYLERPAIKVARKKAATILRNEGWSTDIADDITDVRYMDAVKRALDDQIGSAKRAGLNNQARVLTQLKRDFVGEVDRQVPRYAEARSVFAGEMAIKDASQFGRNMLIGNKYSARDVAEQISQFGESELQAARVGFLDWMTDELSRTSVKRATLANKFADVPKFRDVVRELFPNQNAVDDFLRAAEAQSRFTQTKNMVTGGSPTARIDADRAALSPGFLRVASDAAVSPASGLSSALRLIRGNTTITPEVIEEIGKILFDPNVIPRQLRPNPLLMPFSIPQASPTTAAGMGGGFTQGVTQPFQGMIPPLQESGLLGD